ncbi:AAA domain-containing protein [Vibrio astriarenae]|uniref:AAA domain-containing protein n=1 Tax=Vibrio astriarenae TaxID=1481923 RepID=A0A7Z2T841_9VIBR|nr:MoxR family ATPase [Vibrio astriarenae]QIA66118.1 AAA domain-containing protein [Vibrio astriarenae]
MTLSTDAQHAFKVITQQVSTQVVGQAHVVKALTIGLLTKGHILLEGLPGTAKTRAVKSLAEALSAEFARIQFTPDLLPSDVTGTETYQELDGKPQLNFQPGPIFNNLVLADEINRAPAKVQAALLEAMAEYTITVGGETHALPDLFMVLATQNPVEQEGTYPLPEAQMDRFMLKVNVSYPDAEAEKEIIRLVRSEELGKTSTDSSQLQTITPDLVLLAREQVSQVEISDLCEDYLVALIMATRSPEAYPDTKLAAWIEVGVSPRASIALDKCARANAWLEGRDFVLPDDIRAVAQMVLGHRITLSYDALADGVTQTDVVNELLDHVLIG